MKITVKSWHAIGYWKWQTGQTDENGEDDVCGICRVAFEGCCPSCKMPGDDCPLSRSLVAVAVSWAYVFLIAFIQCGANVVTSFICIVS